MFNIKDLWRLLRPKQWVKSGFVFMGLLFGHAWNQPELIRRVFILAVAFSLVASGVYVLNDIFDRDSDAAHARKRSRPIAAGKISIKLALCLMLTLWLVGFVLGYFVSATVMLILLCYLVLNFGYSLGLKHVVILDVFIIAAGFILRLLAGTTGVGIAPSHWILLCGLMVALFLGFAKRRSELYAQVDNPSGQRRVLESYQAVFLDKMIVITATCVILSYGLYTLSPTTYAAHHTDALIYTLPFVIYGVFRYIYSLHKHTSGSDPAQEIFRDPHLVGSLLGWLLVTVWIIKNP